MLPVFKFFVQFDATVFQIIALIGAMCIGLFFGIRTGRKDMDSSGAITAVNVILILGTVAGAIALIISLFGFGFVAPLVLILIMLGVFAVSFLISYFPIHLFRKSKFKRNPLVNYCADYCRKNNAAAMLVSNTGVKVFGRLDRSYFTMDNFIFKSFENDRKGYDSFVYGTGSNRSRFFPPIDQSGVVHEFEFKAYGYPNLECKQMDYFANAVCGKLRNYKSVVRSIKAELRETGSYTTQTGYSYNSVTKQAYANTDSDSYNRLIEEKVLYYECYIYRKDLADMIKQQKKAENAYYKQQQKQYKSWD